MLNPDVRSLYTSALKPPPNKVFDEAIATAFSLDPAFLLQAPVHLALMAANDQQMADPFCHFEAIRRYSDNITVYVQKGRIQVPAQSHPGALLSLLEPMIVEVAVAEGGVFHPKIWAIRFVNPHDPSDVMYRFAILTRNLTTDASWDLSLQLEGKLAGRKRKANNALKYLLNQLPKLATRDMMPQRREQAMRFAEELQRVEWDCPAGFDELAFYLPGVKGFDWQPPEATRVAVMSPFCSDQALRYIVKHCRDKAALISRPETLLALKPETRELFRQNLHLDDAAESIGEQPVFRHEFNAANGLHVKAYIFESGWDCELVLGSANATNAALLRGINSEILVSLKGRKSQVGTLDTLLCSEGLGRYLVEFDASQQPETDALREEAECVAENARGLLAQSSLRVRCASGQHENVWALVLTGALPELPGITHARAWPVTARSDISGQLPLNSTQQEVVLGEFSPPTLTGLIAFELQTSHPEVSIRFVLNLPIDDVPDERESMILQTIISKQEDFMRYLLMLLNADNILSFATEIGGSESGGFYGTAQNTEQPLLEELIRIYSRTPERLADIAALVNSLRNGKKQLIPEEFLEIWSVFEAAMGE